MDDLTRFITQDEAADILFCSSSQIRKMRQKGLISGTRFGKRWIYKRDDILDFRDRNVGNDFRNFTSLSDTATLRKFSV